MRPNVIEDRLLILLQFEEVVLLLNPLRLSGRMQWTSTVDQVFLLLERFATNAIPAFIHTLVDVAPGVYAIGQFNDASLVTRLRRTNEIVEPDVELRPRVAKQDFHPIAVRDWIEALLHRSAVHVL